MKSWMLAIFALVLVSGAVACAPPPEPETPPRAEPDPQRQPQNDPWHRNDPSMPEIVYASATEALPARVQSRKATW